MAQATGSLAPITNEIRANISAAANLVAFVFSILVYAIWLKPYFAPTKWLLIAWLAMGAMVAYYGWVIPLLPKLMEHLRTAQDEPTDEKLRNGESPDNPDHTHRDTAVPLYLGVLANLFVFGLGIAASGGITVSPFTGYGPALIAFGLFLSASRWTRLGLLAVGLLWYSTLAFCPWVVHFARGSIRNDELLRSDAGMRHAFWLIGCALLIISTLVVRRRAVWEASQTR